MGKKYTSNLDPLLYEIRDSKLSQQLILLHGDCSRLLFAKANQLASCIVSPNISESQIDENLHPDIHRFSPMGKILIHSIDVLREIQKNIWVKPFQSDYKVYIISDIDRMSLPAFSACLKIFEEPPLHAVIILTTTRKSTLPITLLSRVFAVFIEGKKTSILEEKEFHYLNKLLQNELQLGEVASFFKENKEFSDTSVVRAKAKYLLESLLLLCRDKALLELEVASDNLTYAQYMDHIKHFPEIDMMALQMILEEATLALENTSSSTCFEWVALQLSSLSKKGY